MNVHDSSLEDCSGMPLSGRSYNQPETGAATRGEIIDRLNKT